MSMPTNASIDLGNAARTGAVPKIEIPTKDLEGPLKLGTKLVGQSGRQYQIDRILQHRTDPILSCVYLATAKDQKKYVIKNIFHTEFEYQLNVQKPIADYPNLRVVMDTIPENLLFVYNYATDDLLELAEKEDIKPNNIFVDYGEKPNGSIEIKRVQIGDLEMGSVIPAGSNVHGARLGNPMWRSPEAHAAGSINIPSDMFSFGLVCIYTMLRKIIFRINVEGLSDAEEERLIVKRLLSHFGDRDGLVGLLEHLDDEVASWRDLVVDVVKEFTTDDPRKPFSMWREC